MYRRNYGMGGNLSEIGRQISGNLSNVLSNCLNLECKYRYYTVDVSVYSVEISGFILLDNRLT